MNKNVKVDAADKDLAKIRENYDEDYWSKKYGVSADEIKTSGNNIPLQDRIIRALFKKRVFEF